MLHMLVAKHGPDTCPASRPDYRDKYMPQLRRIDEVSKHLGVSIAGSWTNMPAHTTYMLVEAPNAQLVCDLIGELQLMNWNYVESLLPVVTLEQAAATAEQRQL